MPTIPSPSNIPFIIYMHIYAYILIHVYIHSLLNLTSVVCTYMTALSYGREEWLLNVDKWESIARGRHIRETPEWF